MVDLLIDASSPPQWGIRLNTRPVWRDRKHGVPDGCPPWANPQQQREWDEPGLVVWNNATQKLEVLRAAEVLTLLDRLRNAEAWRTAGDHITRRETWLYLDDEPDVKLKPKRKKTKQPPPQEPESEPVAREPVKRPSKVVDREIVFLNPETCQAVLHFLEGHETTLKEAALADEERAHAALDRVYRLLFHQHRVHEIDETPLASRPLAWIRQTGETALVCDKPPNRATIRLTEETIPRWFVCVERPHRFKHESPYLLKLAEALEWAENELTSTENSEEPVEAEETFPPSMTDLRPYVISPAMLEPAQVKYRAVIELERKPVKSKEYKISFGEVWLFDKEYPTAAQLARELKLDAERIDIEHFVESMGWYEIRTLTTFYVEALAAAQAQQLWDRSAIAQRYQAKEITWAFYGYRELETEYTVYLGGCESPDRSSPKPQQRAAYMAEKAKRLTLIHALDVVGYRACLRMKKRWQTDDQLLRGMHEDRAHSPYMPSSAQEESRRWQREHPAETKEERNRS